MDMEKMIVVEKSTKWWLTVATGSALAVGLLGGYGLATAIHGTNSQQSAIQQPATVPGAPEQVQNGQDAGNSMPPQDGGSGQNGQDQGMPSQDGQQSGKDKSKDSSAQQNDNGKKNKKKSSTNTSEQSDKNNNKSTKENKTSQS